jgi:hypothetical protein
VPNKTSPVELKTHGNQLCRHPKDSFSRKKVRGERLCRIHTDTASTAREATRRKQIEKFEEMTGTGYKSDKLEEKQMELSYIH